MTSLLNQIALPLLGTFNQSKVEIRDKPLWFAVAADNGRSAINIEIDCGARIGANQALLQFQFIHDDIDFSTYGFSKSHRDDVGYYIYLHTQTGRHKQTVEFDIPKDQRQILVGVRSWCADDGISLINLEETAKAGVSQRGAHDSSDSSKGLVILISVDVEALPGRAPDRHVERLVWGGSQGKEGHGVQRLAQVFNELGVNATFYVNFAACCLHGDKEISEAAQFLVARGQDVQLHVHSEVLVRNQQWVHATNSIPTFALHSFSTANRAIRYAAEKYQQSLGYTPSIFRAGGLWWSSDSVLATGVNGIPGSSNVSATRAFAPSSDVFNWENGVTELPVNFCLDPYIQNGCESLLTDVHTALSNKTHKVISCYLHSWSLSPRTNEGYHLEHSAAYQGNLEKALSILKTAGSLATSSTAYLKQVREKNNQLLVPLTWREKQLNVNERPDALPADCCSCNICSTTLMKNKLKNDVCPFCRLRTRHRILKSVFDRQLGDLLAGKSILANHADPNEVRYFFGSAKSVTNFDVRPLDYLDAVADVQNLAAFKDGAFDVFYSIYVLNHVADDRRALSEMRRVINKDGLAVVMVPFHVNIETRLHTDITQNYGMDALHKYGVGSYRYYGYSDFVRLLSRYFVVNAFFGVDSVTSSQDAVFICSTRQ